MHIRNGIILAAVLLLLLAAGIVYHMRYARHETFMSGLFSWRHEGRSGDAVMDRRMPGKEPLPIRYVDKVAPDVAVFVSAPEFRKVPLDIRRMKLLEFFALKVADRDYMLLSDADKKKVLDLFMERYLTP
ncbi:MAG: hypothetical protein RDU30_11515 [Desulfovibrionaceae bacterium]|nr:hypothetical protein [Desulfovibrionaceae bacterium]